MLLDKSYEILVWRNIFPQISTLIGIINLFGYSMYRINDILSISV